VLTPRDSGLSGLMLVLVVTKCRIPVPQRWERQVVYPLLRFDQSDLEHQVELLDAEKQPRMQLAAGQRRTFLPMRLQALFHLYLGLGNAILRLHRVRQYESYRYSAVQYAKTKLSRPLREGWRLDVVLSGRMSPIAGLGELKSPPVCGRRSQLDAFAGFFEE